MTINLTQEQVNAILEIASQINLTINQSNQNESPEDILLPTKPPIKE